MPILFCEMVKQITLSVSLILITCNYQALSKVNEPCKKVNGGGQVCGSYLTQSDNRSGYEFKHLSCAQTGEEGRKKILIKETPRQIPVKPHKQGPIVVATLEHEFQLLRQRGVFRKIQMSVAKACLSRSECDVVDSNESETKTETVAGNGYKKLGSGKDTMYIKRFDIKTSWYEAANVCHWENATLVKIDSERKMKEIKANVSKTEDQFNRFYMWIGLRDFHRNNSFTWFDGSPLAFTYWKYPEPSHTDPRSAGTVDEDCVCLVYYYALGVFWSVDNCQSMNGFICERNLM